MSPNIDFTCTDVKTSTLLSCSFNLNKSELHILEYFFRNKTPRSIQDIAADLKLERSGVQKAIKSLLNKEVLDRRQVNNDAGGYYYRYFMKNRDEIRVLMKTRLDSWYSNAMNTINTI